MAQIPSRKCLCAPVTFLMNKILGLEGEGGRDVGSGGDCLAAVVVRSAGSNEAAVSCS